MRLRAIPFLVITSVILCGCQGGSPRPIKKHRVVMGTVVEITVIGRDGERVAAVIHEAFEEMARIEGLMSWKISDSEVSRINRWAGVKGVAVSPEVMTVIRRALAISMASEGYFDISIGTLIDLWGFGEEGGHVPAMDDVKETLRSVNYRAIHVNEEASTVMLGNVGMRIDLGGIAKGYAVDRAFEVLNSRGYRNAIVNAGGDMRAGGRKARGPWVIGIQDPRDRSRLLATFDAVGISIATSGDYERYFVVDGVRHHHLLNPFTGFPARECRSVTILAEDTLSADGLATAVFVMGPERGIRFIEAMAGVEGLIVSADGGTIQSNGLKGKMRFPN